jgi:carbon-monoxide dehydrogenase medium subunit
METALAANFNAGAIKGIKVDPGLMISDMHGDAEYRANLVEVMARRAVDLAA